MISKIFLRLLPLRLRKPSSTTRLPFNFNTRTPSIPHTRPLHITSSPSPKSPPPPPPPQNTNPQKSSSSSSPHPSLLTPFRTFLLTLKCLFLYHYIHNHLYSLESGIGPSMLPTISVHSDWFLISRYYRRGRGIKVGDIVSFDSVVVPGERAFKRVLGVEGDLVMMGTPDGDGNGGEGEMIRIPQGHCWLIGDNLAWSRDSRMFGPVPMALIKGKIIARVLPWSERRWFEGEDDLRPVIDVDDEE